MSRTTHKEVTSLFARWCDTYPAPAGHRFTLDYAACYGGWRVELTKVDCNGQLTGGISTPFGEARMPTAECWRFLYATYWGAEHLKGRLLEPAG